MTAAAFAPAKINLYLHVIGRRSDGYHLLDSLIAFAGVGDTIEAEAADALSLEIAGPFAADVPADDGNLVLRAARALAKHGGVTAGAKLSLTKRLPVASGIGGGSADAAAALDVLARLWQLDVPEDALMTLAEALGADVPICVAGRSAFVGGIGEAIEPAPALPRAALVLANPGVAVATPDVFRRFGGTFSKPARFETAPESAADFAEVLRGRRNDLTVAANAFAPGIGETLGLLAALPGVRLARMSGSGATCFGLVDDLVSAERAAGQLAAERPGWWVAAAPLLAEARDTAPTG